MLIDFTDADAEEILRWRVINDDVMGGLSQSRIELSPAATALFSGQLALEITVVLPQYAGVPIITTLMVVLASSSK